MNSLIEQIRKYVSNDDFRRVFASLEVLVKDSAKLMDASHLRGRYNYWVELNNRGTIHLKDDIVERNLIRWSVLNLLDDIENEQIGQIVNTDNGFSSLKKLILTKSKYEQNLINALRELCTAKNRFEIETIKNLIKYDYGTTWKEGGRDIKIIINNNGDEITLKKVLSYGLSSLVCDAEDGTSTPYVVKILHPNKYQLVGTTFKRCYEWQKNHGSNLRNLIVPIDEIIEKDGIILIKMPKYGQNLFKR